MTTWEQLKETILDGHINWRDLLDDRQRTSVEWSELYARDYHFGDDGHNAKMLIAKMAKMAEMLDAVQDNITIEVDKE